MREKQSSHIEFSNGFTKIRDAFKKDMRNVGILAVLFAISIVVLPENMLSYDKKLAAALAGFGIIASIMIAITNNHFKYKQLQKDTLTKVFELLSRADVRKARTRIHNEYCRLKKAKLDIVFKNAVDTDDLEDNVDLVLSSLDQVSVLVLNGLINKELFFDTYGEMIVRDWKTLRVEIETRQKLNKKTLRHFTALKNEFENRKDIGDTEQYCKDVANL